MTSIFSAGSNREGALGVRTSSTTNHVPIEVTFEYPYTFFDGIIGAFADTTAEWILASSFNDHERNFCVCSDKELNSV